MGIGEACVLPENLHDKASGEWKDEWFQIWDTLQTLHRYVTCYLVYPFLSAKEFLEFLFSSATTTVPSPLGPSI